MFRWFALVILVGSLALSAYHRRRARAATGAIPRRAEGPLFLLARALLTLPLFGSVVLYLINPAWMAWAALDAPQTLRWFGVGLGLLTVPCVHWVLSSLGSNVSETVLTKNDHALVQHGPYRWVRHPLYTTGIALFVALGLLAANAFILCMAALALVAIRTVVIPPEEAALHERFGPQYTAYMQHTGALWPRFMGNVG